MMLVCRPALQELHSSNSCAVDSHSDLVTAGLVDKVACEGPAKIT